MGHLIFFHFGGRRGNMCCLGIDHQRSCLHGGDIALEGNFMGLITVQLASIEIFIRACSCHMAKPPTEQALPL
jgi:hypothetical protein